MPFGANSWNVTANYPAGMVATNTVSGGALIFLILIIFGAIGLILLITSLERYTTFFKMFDKLIHSVRYTIFGAGITAALYAIYLVCEILATFGSGINPIHIGLGIGAYAGVTVLGYAATVVIKKFGIIHAKYKEQQAELKPAPMVAAEEPK